MRIRLSEKELRALQTGGPLQINVPGHAMVSKYHNKKTVVDGMLFDSMAEAARYGILCCRERAGEIAGWDMNTGQITTIAAARQQRFPLWVNGKKVTTYICDFTYRDLATGEIVVEDVKGVRTATYKLKARLFAACLGFPITETGRKERKVR